MNALRRGIGPTLTLLVLAPAFGQSLVVAPEGQPAFRPYQMTPSRVLAGVRGYSDQVVDALARLADHPALLDRAAWAVETGGQPVLDDADLSPGVREALKLLGRSPELLVLTAMHPGELQVLRSLWSVAPEGVRLRLSQLRRGYGQAAREAAWAWQRTLESDPVALGEYRDLLTRFCATQRQVAAGFACVRVTDRRYYYACLPDEAVVAYANEVGLPRALSLALARWWLEHAPQCVDTRLERARAFESTTAGGTGFVYHWATERRAVMWQPAEVGDGDDALGLVPVILQPPADQPSAARLAQAVAEHARLWSPPVPALVLPAPDVASGPEPDAEESGTLIAEAIPGPQTARYEEVYLDTSDPDREEYALPSRVSAYYGYSTNVPYYRGPTYYTYPRVSVFYPDDVFYSCAPYRAGGVYLRGGYGGYGRRVQGSRSYGRIHYGGGRHYGRVSVSADSRGSRGSRRVHISGGDRRQTTHGYRPHSPRAVSRNSGAVRRTSTGRVGRSHAGTRAVRPRMGVTTRSGSRPTIRSGSRGTIRSGSRPAVGSSVRSAIRSGVRQVIRNKVQKIRSNRATRSGGRVGRPSSPSGQRSGGARRR